MFLSSFFLLINLGFPILHLGTGRSAEYSNDIQTNSSSGVISGINNTLQGQTAICADINKSICFNAVGQFDSIVI